MPVSAFILTEPRGDDRKPELRADALQDTPVLREFIKRNNLLGWISRHQFEETWACLLHLLSPVAVTGADDISKEVTLNRAFLQHNRYSQRDFEKKSAELLG